MLTLGSIFAGIGGFDLAFERAQIKALWQIEKDQNCRTLLASKFPSASRFDDVSTVKPKHLSPVDIICGGFPCQDLSIAGKRAGLKGARSGLFYEMLKIISRLKPALVVWENVSGLSSSDDGRDLLRVAVAVPNAEWIARRIINEWL
jgi:DNA (cytosine-5)-methyltransferase 1